MALTVTSPAFRANGEIPRQFTRDDANMSPPMEWHDAPVGTRSFALVVEDPDAPKGMFRHWAVYDIPETSTSLSHGAGSHDQRADLRMGNNDFGNSGYDGPQPPPGHGTHHYHFRLFALRDAHLNVPPRCSAKDVVEAARAHCLAAADLVGTFERPRPAADRPHPTAQRTKADSQVRSDVADADKIARTGSTNEPVRDTPPAGKWNDVAGNE
jgi:hypothetical protein